MHEVEAKGILSAQNGMNIYRGCTHGCIYCDARSTCYRMSHEFEDVEVEIDEYGEEVQKEEKNYILQEEEPKDEAFMKFVRSVKQ